MAILVSYHFALEARSDEWCVVAFYREADRQLWLRQATGAVRRAIADGYDAELQDWAALGHEPQLLLYFGGAFFGGERLPLKAECPLCRDFPCAEPAARACACPSCFLRLLRTGHCICACAPQDARAHDFECPQALVRQASSFSSGSRHAAALQAVGG